GRQGSHPPASTVRARLGRERHRVQPCSPPDGLRPRPHHPVVTARYSPFCFVFFTTVRYVMEVGGALPGSARKALQMMPLPFVARTRAEPLEMAPAPKVPLTESPSALLVPNRTVPPAGTSSEVALGSLAAPPPAKPKISTPTRIVSSVVFVQAKKVSRPPPRTTPGTDQRWKDGCP